MNIIFVVATIILTLIQLELYIVLASRILSLEDRKLRATERFIEAIAKKYLENR